MALRILCVICAYNEVDYLPYVLDHYRRQGIEAYVIDNFSTDGTWEFLQRERVPSERLDTRGSFDLRLLQRARLVAYQRLRPDWVIYGDADEFIVAPRPLREVIERAHAGGYGAIRMCKREFCNTGEPRRKADPRRQFFWFGNYRPIERVHRCARDLSYVGDSVRFAGKRSPLGEGAVWNYGGTKSAGSRAETLERRKIAWSRGLNSSRGSHYLRNARRGWLWSREELLDIRATQDWQWFLASSRR